MKEQKVAVVTGSSSFVNQGGFGIGSFISSGGIVGKEQTMPTLRNEDVSLPIQDL